MMYADLSAETLRVVLAIDNAINQGFHGVSQPADGNYLDTFWQIGREYATALEVLEGRGLKPVVGAEAVKPTADDECESLATRLEKIAQRRFVRVNSPVLTMAETATMRRCADLLRLIPGLLEIQERVDASRFAAREQSQALSQITGPAFEPPVLTEVVTLRVGSIGWFASLDPADRQSAFYLVCAGQAMRARQQGDTNQWEVVFTGSSLVAGKFASMAEATEFADAWNSTRLVPHPLPSLSDVMAIGDAPACNVLPSPIPPVDGSAEAAYPFAAIH